MPLSTSNCRTIRPRVAPSDVRIAISRCRVLERINIRFATFAQAINNTSPTAPSSTNSGVFNSPVNCRRIGTTAAPHFVSKAGCSCASCAAMTFISACACEISRPA